MADELLTGFLAGQDNNGGGGSGLTGGEGLWAVIILALLFGRNGINGNGGNDGGQGGADTRAAIYDGFATNNIQSGITSLASGLCDSTYALNSTLMSGFHGVDSAVCNLGYQTQSGFNAIGTQLAQCCCDTREAISGVRYDMATQACETRHTIADSTRDIIDNQNANYRGLMDFMVQSKIDSLQEKLAAQQLENQKLQFAASQSAQNTYLAALSEAQTAELIRRIAPQPVPSFTVPAPYPYGGYGGGCGCGC